MRTQVPWLQLIIKAGAAQQRFVPVDTMQDEIKKKYKNTAPASQGAPNLFNEVSYISCIHIIFANHWLHISKFTPSNNLKW